ncbi:hypothetical protein RB623_05725 [Mesorhizobium sp. LHD-90]|uniref:hypothetical protein n=1 Tax=Mesorhizobium sp. LHD-90 TaxID=3071414 RepID=UPI0027E1417D|nr:hypothetical protein [Mesorhizobium sp. LHD-90]MDQ6433548.1 hypothetical protein [Mesorhizobium sp. LHD-90]
MSAVAKLEPSSRARELIRHVVASIDASDRYSLPFPHIFFRDFFPSDFYAELIKSIPTGGYYRITSARMALRLYGDNLAKIDGDVRDLWADVSETLTSPEVEDAIRRQLREGLEIRARGDKMNSVEDLKMVARPVLYSDKDGYQIKPHPDTRRKVVTMQLYCPADDSQRELGTTLYQASLKGMLNVGSYGLEPVKTLPFLPNVGYAFVVLKASHSLMKMSWHGRPKIKTPINQPRVSLLNTFYVNEEVEF